MGSMNPAEIQHGGGALEPAQPLFARNARLKLAVWGAVGIVVVACVSLLVLKLSGYFGPVNGLPGTITKQINGFDVYYLKPSFSTDFVLQPSSVKYQNGVLLFSMSNPVGKKLVFTEEPIPPHFDPSILQTTSQSNTEYGAIYITADSDRTVGTLFSLDKTWVIVNSPDPIGQTLMEQVLDALQPIKLK